MNWCLCLESQAGKLQRANFETRCLRKEEGARHSEELRGISCHECKRTSGRTTCAAMTSSFDGRQYSHSTLIFDSQVSLVDNHCITFCTAWQEFATLSDQYAAEISKLDEQCRERVTVLGKGQVCGYERKQEVQMKATSGLSSTVASCNRQAFQGCLFPSFGALRLWSGSS